MNVQRAYELAEASIAAFEDLPPELARASVLWNLAEILEHMTDGPVDVSFVERVEVLLRDEPLVSDGNAPEQINRELPPDVSL